MAPRFKWDKKGDTVKRLQLALIIVILTAGCADEPAGPQPAAWVRTASFPPATEHVNALARSGPSLYAAVASGEGRQGEILEYDYNNFDRVYTTAEHENAAVIALSFDTNGQYGWAAGYSIADGSYLPLLAYRREVNTEWEEIPLYLTGGQVLKNVFHAGPGACFILHDGNETFPLTGSLLKYDNGAVTYFDGLGRISGVYARPNGLPDRFYCVAYEPVSTTSGKGIKIYSTGDDGATWVEEVCPAATFGGRRPAAARAAAWFGTTLYFTVAFDDGATGVVSHAGPAGAPAYKLVFLTYAGPYFTDLAGLAFRGNDSEGSGITADGVGVGNNTAICFTGENVMLEKLPYQLELTALCRAGGNGFWAAGYNYATYNCDLLFHP